MGRIVDQVVQLQTGRVSLLIERVEDRTPATVVLLVPPHAVRETRSEGVVVLAPGWIDDAVA